MKPNLTIVTALLFALLFGRCGTQPSEMAGEELTAPEEAPLDTTPVTVDKETKLKFNFALANIPSPVVMMNDVAKWGEVYNAELFHDTKKSNTYSSEFEKAINLGIYNTDLAYAMVNDKGADVLRYMKTVLVLSDGLGLRAAVDQMVGKRAEKNLTNKDSLLSILQEIFTKSDSYLRTNERVYTATAVFAGSWIESLYLTSKIGAASQNAEVRAKARAHLWEQRQHMSSLAALLDAYKDKKEAQTLAAHFKGIQSELSALASADALDDAKFTAISAKIDQLRAAYTG